MTIHTHSPARKPWTAPVLEQLTVDLDAIANGNGTTFDKNKAAGAKAS